MVVHIWVHVGIVHGLRSWVLLHLAYSIWEWAETWPMLTTSSQPAQYNPVSVTLGRILTKKQNNENHDHGKKAFVPIWRQPVPYSPAENRTPSTKEVRGIEWVWAVITNSRERKWMRSAGDLCELQSENERVTEWTGEMNGYVSGMCVELQYRFADTKGIHKIRLTAISA